MIAALVLALLASQGQDGLREQVARLGSEDPGEARAAWDALAPGVQGLVPACLEAFDEAPLGGRVARGKLLAQHATPEELLAVLALLDDPAPAVRLELFQICSRPDLHGVRQEERLDALERVARQDVEPGLREAALGMMGRLDLAEGCERLGVLARELPAGPRAKAAEALPPTLRGAAVVSALVADGFHPEPARRTPADVLAAVLPAYGEQLANDVRGGATASARAPLVLGLLHPRTEVRVATAQAFQRMIARLRALGEVGRALDLLERLEAQGFDPRIVHYHRALLALGSAGDADSARAAAAALEREARAAAAPAEGVADELQLWLFRAHYLTGVCDLAEARFEAAGRAFARAQVSIEVTLGLGLDLSEVDRLRLAHVDAQHQVGLAYVGRLLAGLGAGVPLDDPGLLELARQAHLASLEAQVLWAQLTSEARSGWNALFEHELSPHRLLLVGSTASPLDVDLRLRLEEDLGRLLATVSPAELPGFLPVQSGPPELVDPVADDRRNALLRSIRAWRLEGVQLAKDEVLTRLRDTAVPFHTREEDANLFFLLQRHEGRLLAEMKAPISSEVLRDLRLPGSQALWLATNLRTEDRGEDARRVAERFRADLEAEGLNSAWYLLGRERLARADLVIGGTYTDEDEPLRAQDTLQRALIQLEELEQTLRERGATSTDLAPTRSVMADVLVALAVNANVKLGRPAEALAWYERAYALRQDEFMSVLLACYRARNGQTAEARALIARARPGPGTYYNLACTHALLGDTAEALAYLELDLVESHPTPAARNKQRAWAREDPDLASLREDPRFQDLVRPR